MEMQNQIQIEDDIKYQHFFSHNDKHYPIIFDYFLSYSRYFKKNQKELENNEFIDLVTEESEDKKDIPDEIIKCFIDYVQRKPIELTDANVYLLNYLGRKYEVLRLIESTNKYIDEHKEGDDIQFLLINQNNNEIETSTQEDAISTSFLDHIKDERLLELNFPILCKILDKFKKQANGNEINDDLIDFYLRCVEKYGPGASKFFEDVDFGKVKTEYLKQLIDSNDFDFHYVNSNLAKTLYQIQQDYLSKTATIVEKLKEYDEIINEVKKFMAEQKEKESKLFEEEISNMQKDIKKLMEYQAKKEEEGSEDDIKESIQSIQRDIRKLKKFKEQKEKENLMDDIEAIKKSIDKLKKRQADQKLQMSEENEVQKLKEQIDDLKEALNQFKKDHKTELKELNEKYKKIIEDQNEKIEELKAASSKPPNPSTKTLLKKPSAIKVMPSVSSARSSDDSSDNEYSSSSSGKLDSKTGLVKPFGIRNLGSTCYMNSALQCLLSLPVFIENVEDMISNTKKKDFLSAFKTFITGSNHGPVRIKNFAAKKNPIFAGNDQHDSFELITTLINQITEDCGEDGNKIFVGNCESIIKCAKCDKESKVDQEFSSLSFSIQKSRNILYIPYKMKANYIALGKIPKVNEKISTIEGSSYKKITINKFVLATKNSDNFDEIAEILPDYSNAYAFEVPEIAQNKGFTVVNLKDEKGNPITKPFLCEVPIKYKLNEDDLKTIILKRLYDVISPEYKTYIDSEDEEDDEKNEEEEDEDSGESKEDKKVNKVIKKIKNKIEFTKPKIPIKFILPKKRTLCNDYINVRVKKEDIFNFSSRNQQNQKQKFTLEQLFNSHIQQCQLEPGCKFTNDCGEKSRCFQRFKYTKLPKVLIFQIKRSSGFPGSQVDESEVSFPHSISISTDDKYNSIKVDPDEDEQNKYELRAISHHTGTFQFGHYWTVGKRGEKWYDFNDSDVTPVSEPTEPSGSAHMVLYQLIE